MPPDGQSCPIFNTRPRPKANVLHRLLNIGLVEYDPGTSGTLWRLTNLGAQVRAELIRRGQQPSETYIPPRSEGR